MQANGLEDHLQKIIWGLLKLRVLGPATGGEFPMGGVFIMGIYGVYRDHGELMGSYARSLHGNSPPVTAGEGTIWGSP